MFVLKVFAVFAMSLAVGALYRIPRNLMVYAGLTGLAGWLIMHGAQSAGVNSILANFFAGLTVGVFAEVMARLLRKPATIFVIPGFIPLVPGREAYMTMLQMVEGKYAAGINLGMQTLLTGGAIAFGLFISTTAFRLIGNYQSRRTASPGE